MTNLPEWVIPKNEMEISPPNNIARLSGTALFYANGLNDPLMKYGINISKIKQGFAACRVNKIFSLEDKLGDLALNKVVDGKPTALAKVNYVCNSINYILDEKGAPKEDFLTRKNILVYAFQIIDLGKIVGEMNVDRKTLSKKINISVEVIDSMIDGYRVGLAYAIPVVNFLKDEAKKLEKDIPESSVCKMLLRKDYLEYFIKVPKVGKPNIKKTYSHKDDSEGEFIFNTDNLLSAPEHGHPWVIRA